MMVVMAGFGAHDARADSWCPPGPGPNDATNKDCVYGVSRKEATARRREWYAARRADAARLPIDHEVIIVAVLTDTARRKDTFCLRVFDAKPSKTLTQRLRAVGRNPRGCFIQPNLDTRYIYSITQREPGSFVVDYGSYCGSLCAGEWLITVRRTPEGALVVAGQEMLSIS